jgi:hypothetical protein
LRLLPLIALSFLAPAGAHAQLHDIELSLGFGLADRTTSGFGSPWAEQDFDHETGLSIDAGARVYMPDIDACIHAGFGIRGLHTAGWALGVANFAFRTTAADFTFSVRSGCLGLGKWLLTGYGGVSFAVLAANEPAAGAPDLMPGTHVSLGGVIGVDLCLHAGAFFVGPLIELRYGAALDGGAAGRTAIAVVAMRFGVELDLGDGDGDDSEEEHRELDPPPMGY